MAAIQCGETRCAVVGGCDNRAHELAFISLEQLGLFDSWQDEKAGVVPGEGAVFLVLEAQQAAAARGARVYARLVQSSFSTCGKRTRRRDVAYKTLSGFDRLHPSAVVAAGEGDPASRQDEVTALQALGIKAATTIHPKPQLGNLFAAAAALQVAMAALLVGRLGRQALANCFGYGSEQAAFVLEKP